MSEFPSDGGLSEQDALRLAEIERQLAKDPRFARRLAKGQAKLAPNDAEPRKSFLRRAAAPGAAFLAVLGAGLVFNFIEGGRRAADEDRDLSVAKAEILADPDLLQRLGLCASVLAEKEAWLAGREADGLQTNYEPPAEFYHRGALLATAHGIDCDPPNPEAAVYKSSINGMEVEVYPWQMRAPTSTPPPTTS